MGLRASQTRVLRDRRVRHPVEEAWRSRPRPASTSRLASTRPCSRSHRRRRRCFASTPTAPCAARCCRMPSRAARSCERAPFWALLHQCRGDGTRQLRCTAGDLRGVLPYHPRRRTRHRGRLLDACHGKPPGSASSTKRAVGETRRACPCIPHSIRDDHVRLEVGFANLAAGERGALLEPAFRRGLTPQRLPARVA